MSFAKKAVQPDMVQSFVTYSLEIQTKRSDSLGIPGNFRVLFFAQEAFVFLKIALLRTIFNDFWLFYDFLEGFCKYSVLIFMCNFGIQFCAFLGLCAKLREN